MIVLCHTCGGCYRIAAKPEEIEALLNEPQWAESFPCVTPLCRGRMHRVRKKFNHKVAFADSIPLHSFYRAINGFGLYQGTPAAFDDVKKVLLTQKIVEVHGMDVGQPERSIIKTLVMGDGTRLHLESSAKGACVYFIEKGTPSCVEAFDHEPETDGGPVHDACSCGEETRRGIEEAIRYAESWGRPSANDDSASGQLQSDLPSVPKAGDERG